MLSLGEPPGPEVAPKLATLSRLRAAGLPVPPGVGLAPGELALPAARAAIAALLAGGPVIVRAALRGEDRSDASGAGLGRSVAGCTTLAEVDAAAREISIAAQDPWLARYSGGAPDYQLLVQREVPRRWLAVLALGRSGRAVELHGAGAVEALAEGATPDYAGPLARCEPAAREALTGLSEQVLRAMSDVPSLDVEAVIDPEGAAWLVQARPLTRPLSPGWPDFLAEVVGEGGGDRVPDLPGLWRLDAEHNPAPLSPAHAGVIGWLAAARPGRTSPRVLAGWLYEPAEPAAAGPPVVHTPVSALEALRRVHLPAARRTLADIEADARDAEGPGLARVLGRALDHLRDVLDRYAGLRVPPPAGAQAGDTDDPLCLRERAAHLDVLPVAWDIASPALADFLPVGLEDPAPEDMLEATPDDPREAWTLLRELDDHLFALGLAPLRRVYLAAAGRLDLGDAVFLLAPDELARVLAGDLRPLAGLAELRAAQERRAALSPPLALHDGAPVPELPARRLRGLPVGVTVRGPLARRRDLADLLTRPPAPGAIAVLPALTAQAAVALQALGVRAVCCEHGGALSHAALMARELGLSALIGCRGCTELPDGAPAELDALVGRLRLLL